MGEDDGYGRPVDVTQCLLITLFIGLVSSVTSSAVDCLSTQLFVLSGLSEPVDLHSCGL